MNREPIEAINTMATESVAAARLPVEDRIPGIRVLDLLAVLQPGIHRLGGSSADGVYLTWAIATPEVAMIRLRDDSGRVQERPPGRHGLVLLGVTSEDPLTHAYAVDRTGEQFATEPLTLWAPPRGR